MNGSNITFSVQEALPGGVALSLSVEELNAPIVTEGGWVSLGSAESASTVFDFEDLTGTSTWTARATPLFPTRPDEPDLLPYKGDLFLVWRGRLAAGELTSGATYTLALTASDADGKTSEPVRRQFYYENDDDLGPVITWTDGGRTGVVTSTNTLEEAPWFTYYEHPPLIELTDAGNGVKSFEIFSDTASLNSVVSLNLSAPVLRQTLLPYMNFPGGDKAGYVLSAADGLANVTTMYFHLDRTPPAVIFDSITVRLANGIHVIDAHVRVEDAASGIGNPPQLLINPPEGPLSLDPYLGPTYPPGASSASVSYTGFTGYPEFNNHMVLVKDIAGHLGRKDLWVQGNNAVEAPPMDVEIRDYDGIIDFTPEISGILIDSARFTVGAPALPEGCTWLESPAGMSAAAYVETRQPSAAEAQTYTYGYWKNVPIVFGYTQVISSHLFTAAAPGAYAAEDVPLGQYARLRIEKTGNTNYPRRRCWYDYDEDHHQDPEEFTITTSPPNSYFYSVTGTLRTEFSFLAIPDLYTVELTTKGTNIGIDTHSNLLITLDTVLAPGKVSVASGMRDPGIPGYRIAGNGYFYDITLGAEFEGYITLAAQLPGDLTAGQASGAVIYHHKDGVWGDITTQRDGTQITGRADSASPFAVLVPKIDTLPPQTQLLAVTEETEGKTYVSAAQPLRLKAWDIAVNPLDVSGLGTVHYLIDAEPNEACLAAPHDPGAPSGTCANSVYAAPFLLAEGQRALSYLGADRAGNVSAPVTMVLYSDGTAPETAMLADGMPVADGATVEVSEGDMITLGAADPVSNGVASGVDAIDYYVDVDPQTCGEDEEEDFPGAPPGTCENPEYQEPFTLAVGTHTVYYRSEDNVENLSAIKTAVIIVTAAGGPALPIVPSSGPIGIPFAIDGSGFGTYAAGTTVLLLGDATAPLTLWTDTQIKGTIPGALAAGQYHVVVKRGAEVLAEVSPFTVTRPELYTLAPSSGPIGIPFTITGAGFGNYAAAYTRVLIGDTTAPLTLWTDTRIQGTVPGSLASGQYPVTVERRTSDGGVILTSSMTFEVVGVSVASMTPVAGPIGLPYVIYGNGFGNYSAGYTKVLIGGTTCPLTLWTDTKIQGTIPGSLSVGEYPVVVERTLNGGQVQSAPVAFSVTAPEAYALSPSSGPIGLPFVITGESFGNYVANYTKVLIGGTAAPLTLWTDTQIKGSIPGSLATGDHEVVVERALNGGVVRTSTFTFTVGTPLIGGVSPSTISIMAPFTITGHNFGNYVANYTKVLINGATTSVSLWTDTKIQGKLPYLPAGTYPAQVQRYLNGGLAESATTYITVEEPVMSSMTPTSGAVGTVFNLYGAGFGPYDATIAKVFVGGVQCALSLWTDTRITGTVPSALSYGTHTVVAARGQALANTLEFYIPGGYSPSMMRPGAGPAALEFKLGEVYVYPDPAKGGKVPTFHIEVGTADSVKLKVFTVAGQLAHETTLTGSPQAVGPVYAYEYAWAGHIASGVYYYTIEAERAGKKLKARGRFSVVR
ncbi:MAG: IPT/TIG domain-containing protein [Elusimicrobiales bacterium]